jgi:hypothetical protein
VVNDGQLYPSWHTDEPPTRGEDPATIRHRKQAQKRRKMQKASRKANRT